MIVVINGMTKVIGILGDPIEHTLSPLIHNTAFKKLRLNYCYVPFNVKRENLKEALEGIRALNIRGVNITVPHKEAVIPYLDEISEEVKYIGAVNTILNENGKLKGFNTDAFGFIKSLQEENISVKGKSILLLGAGGAGKAIAYGVLKEGAIVFVFNRTFSKAFKIKEFFNSIGKIEVVEKIDHRFMEKIQIVINATSLGLKKDDPLPINLEFLKKEQIYVDIVYPKTPLLREAQKKGCKIIDGLGMLLWQAVRAFEIFTTQPAPVEVMKKILKK
jgi:shikimate dehydrogenase